MNTSTGKYPMLTLYSRVFSIAGWLTVVAFTTYGVTQMRYSFLNLFAGLIAGLVIGGGVIVFAELITLFIRIEEHLAKLRQIEEAKTKSS